MLLNYERLFVLLCISVFMLVTAGASIVVACVHPRWSLTLAGRPARQRARLLMAVRLLPSIAGVVATAGAALAFIRYEPPNTSEETGVLLWVTAALAGLLMLMAGWRIGRTSWNTARCHRLVNRLGQRIEASGVALPAWRVPLDFPLAAVSGIVRPRLILSSGILEACPAHELAAVLQHEAAHARHHDNLARACLLACPDLLAISAVGSRVARDWHHAVEEAADEEATGSDTAARAALASALVRVSRMSVSGRPSWMPALALYDGHPLENRVRRLLHAEMPAEARSRMLWWIAGAVVIAATAWLATGPRLLHALMEWAVRHLP